MKTLFRFLLALTASFLFLAQFAGCEKYVLPEMTLSPDTLLFPAAGGEALLQVKSNVAWHLDDVPAEGEWFHFSVMTEESGCDVTVTAQANTGGSRRASVVFRTETLSRRLTLIQEGD